MSKGGKIVFFTYLTFIEIIFIGSCISYSFVTQSDMRNRNQSLMGLVISTAFTILFHVVYILLWKRGYLSNEEPYRNQFNEPFVTHLNMDKRGSEYHLNPPLQAQKKSLPYRIFYNVILPKGKAPYKYILLIIRFLTAFYTLFIIFLTIVTLIDDKILHSCPPS